MLQVKKSSIPGSGKGLYTTTPIKKGEQIIVYEGDTLTWKEVRARYNNDILDANYLFWVKSNVWIDAQETMESKARYANDANGFSRVKGLTNNAEYNVIKGVPYIVATKNIPKGAEIFVSYGADYWRFLKNKAGNEKKTYRK